jgi:uncharacterized protein (TIGR00299 family) protein
MLHLDAFSGIAGNMFLGALLDLGLPRKVLEDDLRGLGVDFRLRIETVRRGALGATYLDVEVPGAKPRRRAKAAEKPARRHPAHDHPHHHGPPLAHAPPDAAHPHAHGRAYAEICRTIEKAKLEEPVRVRALAIFEAIAHAEARVHRVDVADVHFHEVGAVDAIVDVTGAAIGLHRLGISRVTCSPVALGHGHVETAHGRLPLPTPAALELLRGAPTVPAHVAWETVTPTGAAILRTVVDEYRTMPGMIVEAIGHGAGNDRQGPMPNVLRAIIGHAPGLGADRVVVLETHLDDLVPEHFDWLMERLFEAGALDVSIQHLQMKKNRPGFGVRVIALPSDRLRLARVLFAESTAIGVRTTEADRILLARERRRVSTAFGKIDVKVVRDGEGRVEVSAEYDDCKRVAKAKRVPLRDVVRAAEEAARKELVHEKR